MTLEYNNIFEVVSESSEKALSDQKRSDLIIKIHKYADFDSIPLKHIASRLGVTVSTAKALAKGNVDGFNVFELETFLKRITSQN